MRSKFSPLRKPRRLATVIQVSLTFGFVSIAAVMLAQARYVAWSEAAQRADNIATVLQRDIESNVSILDLSLRTARDGMRMVESHQFSDDVNHAILFDGALAARQFGRMLILDDSGHIRLSSDGSQPDARDFSDREYFRAHREDAGKGMVMTLVKRNALTGQPVIVLSRRIDNPDGSFAGVAAASIRMPLFEDSFGALTLEPQDDVSVMTADGRGIYRRNGGSKYFADDMTANANFVRTRDAKQMVFEGISVADGVTRIFAHRRLSNIPLNVVVGLSLDEVYREWRREAWIIGSALIAIFALQILMTAGLLRALRRRGLAEVAARESEGRYRLLADHMSDMVSRVGPDGARRYVSPAARRLFGVPPSALLGHAIFDYIFPEDRAALIAMRQRLLSSELKFERNQFRIRRADGAERWVETASQGLRDPETGAPDGYVAIWRDITDQKRVETLLVASEAQYRLLADSTTDVIACLTVDRVRTYVSPACRRVLGYEPWEMLGQVAPDYIHPEDAEETSRRFARLAAGEVERDVTTNRIRHKDGHWVWCECSLSLVRDPANGEPRSIISAIRDITERMAQADELISVNRDLRRLSSHLAKARDAAEHASRAKSRFLASISHELRTPLNGILGYAELLRIEGGLSSTQAPRIDAMLGAGQHLLEMINCVLDLTEVETGHIELHPVETDLGEVAAACIDLVRPTADRKNLALALHADAESNHHIVVDRTRLRQILINLLGNAVKYTERGRVDVHIRPATASTIRIDITDTGPGVAKDLAGRLFQEFDRLTAGESGVVEGAGLGLALSAKLATVMGGSIGYAPNPNGGSIFWLDLPAVAAEQQSVAILPTPGPGDAPASLESAPPGLRVLVVDDMLINRDLAASFLRPAGHTVTCVSSGEEAVAVAAANDFDLILMDVRMPGLGGLGATRAIRELPGPRGTVPIVALTAQAFAEQVAECRAAGMDSHLTKPFTQSALVASVDQAHAAKILHRAQAVAPQTPGDEHPVLDSDIFAGTAAYLSAEGVSAYMRALAERTDRLLRDLRLAERAAPPDAAIIGATLADAHALAGSAGMLGFNRLSAVGRDYEYAVETGLSELPAILTSLIAAAEASLAEMRRHLNETPVTTPAGTG